MIKGHKKPILYRLYNAKMSVHASTVEAWWPNNKEEHNRLIPSEVLIAALLASTLEAVGKGLKLLHKACKSQQGSARCLPMLAEPQRLQIPSSPDTCPRKDVCTQAAFNMPSG